MSTADTQTPDYLSMSDEDIMNMSAPTAVAELAPADEAEPVQNEPEAVADTQETAADVEDASDEAEEDAGTASDDGEVESAATQKASAVGDKPAEPVEQVPTAQALDYEAEYKRIMAPFKANGREISVGSPEDAVALMQMGANYNKKMAALKPNLKLMKLLENNGLLSEEKISYLIELERKNPDAINKLVKDSGLNPMDLDTEKASEYQPKIHTVDEREMALDTVLDEIQDTPSYTRTLSVVSKEWDGASKQVIAQSPQLLKVINDHVSSGIFDTIVGEMERERVFGRLNGLSDIEAYRQVGDAIQARGGFNHLVRNQGNAPAPQTVVTPKPKKIDDEKLNEKRRAASSTKAATPAPVVAKDFNPLAMSDAEFAKLAETRFR